MFCKCEVECQTVVEKFFSIAVVGLGRFDSFCGTRTESKNLTFTWQHYEGCNYDLCSLLVSQDSRSGAINGRGPRFLEPSEPAIATPLPHKYTILCSRSTMKAENRCCIGCWQVFIESLKRRTSSERSGYFGLLNMLRKQRI